MESHAPVNPYEIVARNINAHGVLSPGAVAVGGEIAMEIGNLNGHQLLDAAREYDENLLGAYQQSKTDALAYSSLEGAEQAAITTLRSKFTRERVKTECVKLFPYMVDTPQTLNDVANATIDACLQVARDNETQRS